MLIKSVFAVFTWDVSDCVTLSSKSSYQHLIVLLNVVQGSVSWHESGYLLTVLDQLHSYTLSDGRIRLFSLHTYLNCTKTIILRFEKTTKNTILILNHSNFTNTSSAHL